MAIFIEKAVVQLELKALELLSCHKHSNHAAVVCNEPFGQVFIIAEGNLVTSSPWKSPSKVLAISWHPTLQLLTVGLDSGDLFLLLLSETKQLKDTRFASPQKNPIQILEWLSDNQLLSLDSTGLLFVWNFSKDGYFQLLTEYDLKDTPSQMACITQNGALWECYIGSPSGTIYQIVQNSSSFSEILNMDKAIQNLTSHEDCLCILTFGGVLTVYRRDRTDGLQLLNTVKLSGKARLIQINWLSRNLIALTGGDLTIRLWDCQTNDTFVLPMPDMAELHTGAEHFTTLAYKARQIPMLAAATNLGGIAFWRRIPSKQNPEDEWYFVGLVGLPGGSMEQSGWASDSFFVHNGSNTYEITQQKPCVVFKNNIGAVQLSSQVLSVQKDKVSVQVDVPLKIAGLDVCDSFLLVWGDGKVAAYQLTSEKPFLSGTFESNATNVLLSSNACFCLENVLIQMRSFQGSLLTTLSFMDSEGVPVLIDRCGKFLCAGSSSGYVKLWDLSNREPKLHVSTKNVTSNIANFTRFHCLRVNSDGSCVSFTFDEKLYVWRTSWNTVDEFHVSKEWIDNEKSTLANHFWDDDEPRIVIAQLNNEEKSCLVSLMVANEDLLVHDVVEVAIDPLVGVALPHYAVLDESAKIQMRTLNSLSSLDDQADKSARDALLSFSCHLRRGRIEQAYQSVRTFNNSKIWNTLARTCVEMKRPDVGLICLGKLKNARGAQSVRMAQSKYKDRIEAITAVLAVQLNMINEAEKLCEESGSYELLNRIYQASNRWQDALQLAHTKDRINLKKTYYNYARYLEAEGKFEMAKEMFEKCNTHHFDVPRMLFDDSAALQEYCTSSDDPERLRWWAQYLESSGEMDSALEHYARAGDFLSLVRLHCYLGDLERATELAEQSQDRAACFHVARQHESNNNITEALRFFAQANAFGNAVRLCKEHGLDDQLYRYAMQGDHEEMIEAARYFESSNNLTSERQPRYDRAVILYSKAGLLDTALDLASRTDQHEAVLELARRLDSTSNPASLQRCANYLASHKHYDAAVDLLAMAGKNSEAIEMCLKYNVKLNEQLAEQLTSGEKNNNRLLYQLAEAAQRQGDYQLAAKKFTQAGDKYQAMKALLKSGDTEKIVFFANVSRNADIYILAGNYLQTLDWRAHPEYVKYIVNFYTKAKSFELLAGFYESCAQIEVDEYRNYESALNALKEAQKILMKTQSSRTKTVNSKIEFLEHFLSLCQVCSSNPGMISQFDELLKSHFMELGILKPGNIFAAAFQLQTQHKLFNPALNTLNMMKSQLNNLLVYLSSEEIISLCTTLNVPTDVYLKNIFTDDHDISDEIAEVIQHK